MTGNQPKVAALVVCVMAATVGIAFARKDDSPPDSGPYSFFTREALRTSWPDASRSPLMVPSKLPPIKRQVDGLSFYLSSVVTDPGTAGHPRQWVSYYESDALGGEGSEFRVFQRRASDPETGCGPMGQVPSIARDFGRVRITICSQRLTPDSPASDYWSEVPFTSNLDKVSWLVD